MAESRKNLTYDAYSVMLRLAMLRAKGTGDVAHNRDELLRRIGETVDASGPRHFILDENHRPVPVGYAEYVEWSMQNGSLLRVACDELDGGMIVSTIFMGRDHRYIGDGPPLLFETIVFGEDNEPHYQDRTSTWEEAEAMHADGLEIARRILSERE